jgi:hypothetical protein
MIVEFVIPPFKIHGQTHHQKRIEHPSGITFPTFYVIRKSQMPSHGANCVPEPGTQFY